MVLYSWLCCHFFVARFLTRLWLNGMDVYLKGLNERRYWASSCVRSICELRAHLLLVWSRPSLCLFLGNLFCSISLTYLMNLCYLLKKFKGSSEHAISWFRASVCSGWDHIFGRFWWQVWVCTAATVQRRGKRTTPTKRKSRYRLHLCFQVSKCGLDKDMSNSWLFMAERTFYVRWDCNRDSCKAELSCYVKIQDSEEASGYGWGGFFPSHRDGEASLSPSAWDGGAISFPSPIRW